MGREARARGVLWESPKPKPERPHFKQSKLVVNDQRRTSDAEQLWTRFDERRAAEKASQPIVIEPVRKRT